MNFLLQIYWINSYNFQLSLLPTLLRCSLSKNVSPASRTKHIATTPSRLESKFNDLFWDAQKYTPYHLNLTLSLEYASTAFFLYLSDLPLPFNILFLSSSIFKYDKEHASLPDWHASGCKDTMAQNILVSLQRVIKIEIQIYEYFPLDIFHDIFSPDVRWLLSQNNQAVDCTQITALILGTDKN